MDRKSLKREHPGYDQHESTHIHGSLPEESSGSNNGNDDGKRKCDDSFSFSTSVHSTAHLTHPMARLGNLII